MRSEGLRRLGAEFVVVVVGVFLALAAQSWYEGWTEAKGLTSYKERLIGDLQADSAACAEILRALDRKDAALARVASVALRQEDPDSLFIRALDATTWMGFHTPSTQRGTYEDLLATGNLRLLPDPVRRQVVAHYQEMADQWDRVDERRTEYPSTVYRLDPVLWNDPRFPGAFDRMKRAALDSVRAPRFLNLLNGERQLSAFQRGRAQEALAATVELLAILRAAV